MGKFAVLDEALVHNPTAPTLDRMISQPITVGRFVIGCSMTVKLTTPTSIQQAIRLLGSVCQVAGARSVIDDARVGLARHRVIAAVQRHDTAAIFDWLIDALSYQGVSDNIAYGYMEQHGRIRWQHIDAAVRTAELPQAHMLLGV